MKGDFEIVGEYIFYTGIFLQMQFAGDPFCKGTKTIGFYEFQDIN